MRRRPRVRPSYLPTSCTILLLGPCHNCGMIIGEPYKEIQPYFARGLGWDIQRREQAALGQEDISVLLSVHRAEAYLEIAEGRALVQGQRLFGPLAGGSGRGARVVPALQGQAERMPDRQGGEVPDARALEGPLGAQEGRLHQQGTAPQLQAEGRGPGPPDGLRLRELLLLQGPDRSSGPRMGEGIPSDQAGILLRAVEHPPGEQEPRLGEGFEVRARVRGVPRAPARR